MKIKELTPEERTASLAICKQADESRRGLCERDYPRYKHRKTGKVVKLMHANMSWHFPSIEVVAVERGDGKRHVRKTPVGALNFQRDYELIPAQPAHSGQPGATAGAEEA